MISLFNGIDPILVKNITIDEGLDRIKTGFSLNLVEKIRQSNDKSEIDFLKRQLYSITWAGSFSKRNAASLVKASGFAILDFDHIKDAEFVKQFIFDSYEHIYAAWISPSGNGVKALVKIPIVKNDIEYKEYYNAIIETIDIANTDKSTKDICRLCFESYDPDILIRDFEKTSIWKKKIQTETNTKKSYKVVEDTNVQIDRIYNLVSEKMRAAPDGEKYYTILKCGRLLGGYVATGVIQKSDAVCLLETEIQNRKITNFKAAQKAIDNSIEYGTKDPIYPVFTKQSTVHSLDSIADYEIPVEKFPIDIFPALYEKMIKQLDNKLNFPPDFSAFSILWVWSVVMGKNFYVKIKDGYHAYPVLWFASVGEPGVSKSHPIKFIKKPLDDYDKTSYDLYKKNLYEWGLVENNREPKPKWRKYQISDFTFEAIEKIMSATPQGVGLYVDEMAIWIDNVNRYSSGNALSQWLALYDSGRLIIDRKTMEPVMIDKACIPIIGTIQPNVLLDYFNKYSGNGFFDRFLFAFPDTTMRPLNRENGMIENFDKHCKLITGMIDAFQFNAEPYEITFDRWEDYNEINVWLINKYNDGTTNQRLKGYIPKLITSIPRLAIILEMINFVTINSHTPQTITTQTMQRTKKLIMYLYNHAEKVLVNFNKTVDINRILMCNQNKSRQEQCEILQKGGIKIKDIAAVMNLSESTVKNNLKRAKKQK